MTLDGRDWLVDAVEEGDTARVVAKPARYRLRLRHPDGREELGAFRRMRAGQPATRPLVHDARGRGSRQLGASSRRRSPTTSRTSRSSTSSPSATTARPRATCPTTSSSTRSPASADGSGRRQGVDRRGDALRACRSSSPRSSRTRRRTGRRLAATSRPSVSTRSRTTCSSCAASTRGDDSEGTWLETVQARLRDDLESFSADVEGDHDEIEEWDFHRRPRLRLRGLGPDDEVRPRQGSRLDVPPPRRRCARRRRLRSRPKAGARGARLVPARVGPS